MRLSIQASQKVCTESVGLRPIKRFSMSSAVLRQ